MGEADDIALEHPKALSGVEGKVEKWNQAVESSKVPAEVVSPPVGVKVATVVKGKVELADSDLHEFIRK